MTKPKRCYQAPGAGRQPSCNASPLPREWIRQDLGEEWGKHGPTYLSRRHCPRQCSWPSGPFWAQPLAAAPAPPQFSVCRPRTSASGWLLSALCTSPCSGKPRGKAKNPGCPPTWRKRDKQLRKPSLSVCYMRPHTGVCGGETEVFDFSLKAKR